MPSPIVETPIVYAAGSNLGSLNCSPRTIMAQAMRAILLASATAATLIGRRSIICASQRRRVPCCRAYRITTKQEGRNASYTCESKEPYRGWDFSSNVRREYPGWYHALYPYAYAVIEFVRTPRRTDPKRCRCVPAHAREFVANGSNSNWAEAGVRCPTLMAAATRIAKVESFRSLTDHHSLIAHQARLRPKPGRTWR